MAGQRCAASARGYVSPGSENWVPLGFAEFPARSTQGEHDIRVPVASNQNFAALAVGYQGLQLRQPLSLLSQRYNVSFAAHVGAPWSPPTVQLATNKVTTGLGIGTLKNLNVNAKTTFTNLLAKATASGRLSNRIAVQ